MAAVGVTRVSESDTAVLTDYETIRPPLVPADCTSEKS
jgi:hypothetical protein